MEADLDRMGLLSSNAWIKHLKDKKGKTVLYDFIEILYELDGKLNKSRFYQGK